ncbi:hypothetical protein, partial [Streptomyces galbus]|uniref:hypothetical protein n=1 Tax=Streptomyces galbus TaxID=33898 RepID=UPI001B33E9DE
MGEHAHDVAGVVFLEVVAGEVDVDAVVTAVDDVGRGFRGPDVQGDADGAVADVVADRVVLAEQFDPDRLVAVPLVRVLEVGELEVPRRERNEGGLRGTGCGSGLGRTVGVTLWQPVPRSPPSFRSLRGTSSSPTSSTRTRG